MDPLLYNPYIKTLPQSVDQDEYDARLLNHKIKSKVLNEMIDLKESIPRLCEDMVLHPREKETYSRIFETFIYENFMHFADLVNDVIVLKILGRGFRYRYHETTLVLIAMELDNKYMVDLLISLGAKVHEHMLNSPDYFKHSLKL